MRYAIWFAALALALSGCSSGTRSGGGAYGLGDCKRPDTRVVFTVGGGFDITPHEDIHVCDRNVVLTWEIDDSQKRRYEFHENSIEIADNGSEFLNCKVGKPGDLDNGKKKIRCTDVNARHGSGGGTYKYTIRVYEIGGGAPAAEKDPVIMND